MLQSRVEFHCIGSNFVHLFASWTRQVGKVRRYIQLFVASELVSDVEAFTLDRVHRATMSDNLTYLRRISAFLSSVNCGLSSGGSL